MAMNQVIPVAKQYQTKLLDSIHRMQQVFDAAEASKLTAENLSIVREISKHCSKASEGVEAMVEARKKANRIESERLKAIAYHDEVESCFEQIRYHLDKLEYLVDDRMWILPKYRELLNI